MKVMYQKIEKREGRVRLRRSIWAMVCAINLFLCTYRLGIIGLSFEALVPQEMEDSSRVIDPNVVPDNPQESSCSENKPPLPEELSVQDSDPSTYHPDET